MVPEHYQTWLRGFRSSDSVFVKETTRDCRLCEQASSRIAPEKRFSQLTKCCTYFPFLPNFSLGMLFQKADPAIDLRLRQAFAQGRVTPIGLFPSPSFELRREELGEFGFGRAEELLCPFYERLMGACSIWSLRPGVCHSYLCQSTYGDQRNDQRENLKSYLNLFEWTLAHEVLWRLGFTQDDIRQMEEARQAESYQSKKIWGGDVGQEAQFFLRCAETATSVLPEEIEELMGAKRPNL